MNKPDIRSFDDIKWIVDAFYQKARNDNHIGPFFNDLKEIDWVNHFPKIYRFWDSVLFSTATYRGNAILPHIELSRLKAIEAEHFATWLKLWKETINDHFEGEISELAKNKAVLMAELMKVKINQSQNKNFIQ